MGRINDLIAQLKAAEQSGDLSKEREVCQELGVIFQRKHQYGKAIEFYERHLVLLDAKDATAGAIYRNIGDCYQDMGKPREALRELRVFRDFAVAIGSKVEEQRALVSIGNVLLDLLSANLYDEDGDGRHAAGGVLSTGNKENVVPQDSGGNALQNNGKTKSDAREKKEKTMEAMFAAYTRAHQLAVELSSESAVSRSEAAEMLCGVHVNLGNAYDLRNNADRTEFHASESLRVARESGLKECELRALVLLGSTYASTGRTTEAVLVLKDGIRIAKSTQDKQAQADILNQLGIAHLRAGQHESAGKAFAHSHRLMAELGSDEGVARATENIKLTKRYVLNKKRAEEAEKSLQQATDALKSIDDGDDVVDLRGDGGEDALARARAVAQVAELLERAGDLRAGMDQGVAAASHYERLAQLIEREESAPKDRLGAIYFSLGMTCHEIGDIGRAVRAFASAANNYEDGGIDQVDAQWQHAVCLEKAMDSHVTAFDYRELASVFMRCANAASIANEPKWEYRARIKSAECLQLDGASIEAERESTRAQELFNIMGGDVEMDEPGYASDGDGGEGSDVDAHATGDADEDEEGTIEALEAVMMETATGRRSRRTGGSKKAVNRRNEKGETPLHIAAQNGNVAEADRLLTAGADIDAKDNAGWTPLHDACNHGEVEMVRLLIERGADMFAKGLDDETPLHDACRFCQEDVVSVLLEHNAPLDAKNRAGQTPMQVAESHAVVKMLCAKAGIPAPRKDEWEASRATAEGDDVDSTPKKRVSKRTLGSSDSRRDARGSRGSTHNNSVEDRRRSRAVFEGDFIEDDIGEAKLKRRRTTASSHRRPAQTAGGRSRAPAYAARPAGARAGAGQGGHLRREGGRLTQGADGGGGASGTVDGGRGESGGRMDWKSGASEHLSRDRIRPRANDSDEDDIPPLPPPLSPPGRMASMDWRAGGGGRRLSLARFDRASSVARTASTVSDGDSVAVDPKNNNGDDNGGGDYDYDYDYDAMSVERGDVAVAPLHRTSSQRSGASQALMPQTAHAAPAHAPPPPVVKRVEVLFGREKAKVSLPEDDDPGDTNNGNNRDGERRKRKAQHTIEDMFDVECSLMIPYESVLPATGHSPTCAWLFVEAVERFREAKGQDVVIREFRLDGVHIVNARDSLCALLKAEDRVVAVIDSVKWRPLHELYASLCHGNTGWTHNNQPGGSGVPQHQLVHRATVSQSSHAVIPIPAVMSALESLASPVSGASILSVCLDHAGICGVWNAHPVFHALRAATSLTSLSLRHNSIGDGEAAVLADGLLLHLPSLATLDLTGNCIGHVGLDRICKAFSREAARAVRVLRLSHNVAIGNDVTTAVGSVGGASSLPAESPAAKSIATLLEACLSLEELRLDGCGLSPSFFADASLQSALESRASSLKILYVGDNDVCGGSAGVATTPDGYAGINPDAVSGHGTGDGGLAFAAAFRRLSLCPRSCIMELNIASTSLTPAAVAGIAAVVTRQSTRDTSIAHPHADANADANADADGGDADADAVHTEASLWAAMTHRHRMSLSLADCAIIDADSCVSIATMIHAGALRTLDLYCAGVTPAGAAILARVLVSRNNNGAEVDNCAVDGRMYADGGIQRPCGCGLESVSLRGNPSLSDAGARVLARALLALPKIASIDFSACDLGVGVVVDIVKSAFARGSSLAAVSINVSENRVGAFDVTTDVVATASVDGGYAASATQFGGESETTDDICDMAMVRNTAGADNPFDDNTGDEEEAMFDFDGDFGGGGEQLRFHGNGDERSQRLLDPPLALRSSSKVGGAAKGRAHGDATAIASAFEEWMLCHGRQRSIRALDLGGHGFDSESARAILLGWETVCCPHTRAVYDGDADVLLLEAGVGCCVRTDNEMAPPSPSLL